MALATAADVEAALGRDLTDTEDVDFLLEVASDEVVGYLRYLPDPVPGAVVRVVAAMVATALTRPPPVVDGIAGLTAGPYGVRFTTDGASSGGPRLTVGMKKRLNVYRRLAVVDMSSESYDPDYVAPSFDPEGS